MDLRVPSEPQAEKENEASNGSSTGGIAFEKVQDNPAGGGAPSPNTLRKRRREAIAKKVESRKALMTTASSSRLDMSKVHSILSGPRLSWDWQSAGGNKNDAEGEEDDSCGLIVDFHQDSRSALRTHISKAMSQMASKEISSQSIPSSLGTMRTNSEDIKQIIQMKRNLIASQATQLTRQVSSPGSSQVVDNKDEEPPALEPIHPWQETQMPAATQIFIQVESPIQNRNDTVIEEEIDMDDIGFTQVYCPEDDCAPSPAVEKTQVYVPLKPESVHHETKAAGVRTLKAQVSKASSTISIPPNDEQEEIGSDVSSDGTPSPRRKEPKTKSSADELSFEEWLEARKNRKRAVKKQSKEARSFFEAEAEESEDEEFGGIIRRGERGDESGGTSSSDDDGDSDLEDLVASARDEFDLLKQSGKDSNKLAKLHAKWIEEKDAELEKAIENQDFWKKKRTGLGSVDDGTDVSLMNRMQRKLKAKHQAFVQQYDAEGNPLAPEYASDESDYDSMEIDSDEFYDDEISGDDERELDPQELALRQERREREKERRRRDLLLKMEMDKRRQLLKAKLRAERLNREKDKREIQAGLGIMPEEDQESFKLINRTQGVFGFTQTSGTVTQSTSASHSLFYGECGQAEFPDTPTVCATHSDSVHSSSPIAAVLVGSLRAIGQVAFVNSAITGSLILIGCVIERPIAAALGLIACLIGTLLGFIAPGERINALNGLHGYNGYLFGMGLGYFNYNLSVHKSSGYYFAVLLPTAFVGAVICFLINVALRSSVSTPPFTFAYNITLSCWLAYASSLSGSSDFVPTFFYPSQPLWVSYSEIDFGWYMRCTLAGIGQVFFSPELRSSIFIVGGLAIGSPISALLALLGSAVGTAIAVVSHASATLSEEGVYGISAVLGSIGLGGFYFYFSLWSVGLSVITSILCVVMTPVIAGLFVRPNGPAMTFPFCVAATLMHASAKALGRPSLVPVDSLESPEAHLISPAIND